MPMRRHGDTPSLAMLYHAAMAALVAVPFGAAARTDLARGIGYVVEARNQGARHVLVLPASLRVERAR
jgi:hypothetical protein